MAHMQYMPGDPRLVDQLVYELKSKGIFDQFRKDCIADVDTRPAYQNLRQRVETSVSTFLSRQVWKPDLNKNQLREKLRKHILDGNYLEQGVERIVDQVVNPKVASVFIPQVEDLVYNYLGITRKKAPEPGTNENKPEDLLPTDLEAVSPGSVKSNDDKNDEINTDDKNDKTVVVQEQMEIEEVKVNVDIEKKEKVEITEVAVTSNESENVDKSVISLSTNNEIKLESIPAPVNSYTSPPKETKVELDRIVLPHEPNLSVHIPLPDETPKQDKEAYFKPINSDDSSSSSDSSLRRNMSPLTPIRNFNNENSCDAQQGFDDNAATKSDNMAIPSSFRFTIEAKDTSMAEINPNIDADKKETDTELSFQFTNQVQLNTFNTPMYDDSSNSHNLHIDYESDVNSKTNTELKPDIENSQESKKDRKSDDKKSSHKSSHRSRDSNRHSSSKDKRSDSKHSTSRDSSRHDKKSSSSKDDKYKSSKDGVKDKNDKKDSRDSSKHRSSHKSSNNKEKDSKSHRSSSSSHRHSSKSTDDKKSSSSKDKEKTSDSSKDKSSKDRSRDSKSSSHKSDKDKKSSSSSSKKSDDKDKKKDKKDTDDHYSSSGRGNHGRRSTDRDSNDGSTSSKGFQQQNGSKSSESKKESKNSSSKSETTSTSGDSASPSDKEHNVLDNSELSQFKPIVRVDNHLETPIANPPRLPFVPDVTLKKPRFAANLQEAKKLMKMRKFLDEEQKRMNQEAALLLEFQANVRPSLSQVYSSIPGPELEFACVSNVPQDTVAYEMNAAGEQNDNSEIDQTVEDKSADVEVANISDVIKVSEIEEIQQPDTKTAENNNGEIIKVISVNSDDTELPQGQEIKDDNTYDENKPFSELMDEITEYSKASETKTDEVKSDIEEDISHSNSSMETETPLEVSNQESSSISETTVCGEYTETKETTESIGNKYFEITIITEELSESEETEFEQKQDEVFENKPEEFNQIEDKVVLIDNEENNPTETTSEEVTENKEETEKQSDNKLQYFAEHEKYDAELERQEFSSFLKKYIENIYTYKKMYLINCDTYEESIVKEIAATFGDYEVINYYKNGHLKLPNTSKNLVKDVKLGTEVTLPLESKTFEKRSPLFSPVKSECSFELTSDYDTKLDDINKKSRQEVMEIILGSIIDASPSKMPKIDYYTESVLETEIEDLNTQVEREAETTMTVDESETETSLKRRIDEEVESSVNNNRTVLTPNKIRKLSDSDEISSTTEETEESSNNNKVPVSGRSKYLGRARRVGLPRPKRCNISNSPSSDKSVENYIQNTPVLPPTPNGKLKSTPRTKIQRYDTSDLYKPKLHYLSRRNNVS